MGACRSPSPGHHDPTSPSQTGGWNHGACPKGSSLANPPPPLLVTFLGIRNRESQAKESKAWGRNPVHAAPNAQPVPPARPLSKQQQRQLWYQTGQWNQNTERQLGKSDGKATKFLSWTRKTQKGKEPATGRKQGVGWNGFALTFLEFYYSSKTIRNGIFICSFAKMNKSKKPYFCFPFIIIICSKLNEY